MKKISIIVPVYYNEDNLLPLYADLKEKVLDPIQHRYRYEIVMVDDGSKDRSFEVMNHLASIDEHIKIYKLSRNFGEHSALLAGLNVCTGDIAVRKAADLQEPSEMILDMLKEYEEGNSVILAVREGREESEGQKFFSNLYAYLMRKFALSNMPKGGFDSFMIDRQVIDTLIQMNEKNTSLMAQVLWCGFPTSRIGYVRKKREIGTSKWTLSKKIKLVLDSLLGFSYFPIRCILMIGAASFVISFIWSIVLIVQRLMNIITVEGYTTIIILILFAFSIIMGSLGILGEYIWRMFDATRNRPPFIFDHRTKEEMTKFK